jgi:outer membrane lipoprotein-sorting protein
MDKEEKLLSDYIDALNAEKEPEKNQDYDDTSELEKLKAAVRMVRMLKEPLIPDAEYPQRLARGVHDRIQNQQRADLQQPLKTDHGNDRRSKGLSKKPGWVLPSIAALAAGICIFAIIINWSSLFKTNVVLAMEQAVAKIYNYHGVMEIRSTNAAGETWMVRQVELWSDGEKYAMQHNDGTLTVNNGQRKWQVRPGVKEVAILPVTPDPTRNSFDLRDEAQCAQKYPHSIIGTEMIAGRESIKIEILPPGGLAYYLWIDKDTNLPVQLQTAMQNALQTTYTFISFEPNTQIDPQVFAFQLPAGYKVVEKEPGQLVATLEEAVAISQFTPLLPQESPARIFAYKDRIVLDYGETSIVESPAQQEWEPKANSALGIAAGGPLEIWWERLRWQQNGVEIQIQGPRGVELARQIAPDLTIPSGDDDLAKQAQIHVQADMEIVKASQQQVDRGSSPWQLDPMQVALTFVNLKASPEGIVGEPKIPASSFKITANNGVYSVVEVATGPIKKVYLQRLVRQDETGIWSVVGYDPR